MNLPLSYLFLVSTRHNIEEKRKRDKKKYSCSCFESEDVFSLQVVDSVVFDCYAGMVTVYHVFAVLPAVVRMVKDIKITV